MRAIQLGLSLALWLTSGVAGGAPLLRAGRPQQCDRPPPPPHAAAQVFREEGLTRLIPRPAASLARAQSHYPVTHIQAGTICGHGFVDSVVAHSEEKMMKELLYFPEPSSACTMVPTAVSSSVM